MFLFINVIFLMKIIKLKFTRVDQDKLGCLHFAKMDPFGPEIWGEYADFINQCTND